MSVRYYLIRAKAQLRIATLKRCGTVSIIRSGEYALVSEQVKNALLKKDMIAVLGRAELPAGCPIRRK